MPLPPKISYLAQLLAETFAQRQKGRKAYSFRAFARDIGVSHTTLRKVLAGTMGMRLATAKQVLSKLKLEPQQLREALARIRIESEKDEGLRSALISVDTAQRVEAENRRELVRLAPEEFPDSNILQAIQLLSLFPLHAGQITPAFVYKKLRIPSSRASAILEVLEKKALVHRDAEGAFHAYPKRWEFVSVRHSPPLKQCHLDALSIAEKKIRELAPTERYSATEFLPISSVQQTELNAICDEFVDRLRALSDLSEGEHDRIYLVSLHAVPSVSR